MNYYLNGKSVWGKRVTEIDPRSIRRTNLAMKKILNIGESACLILAPLLIICIVIGIFKINFEDVEFFDGTNDICIYSGELNEVSHVNVR